MVAVRDFNYKSQRLPPPINAKYINPGPGVPNVMFTKKHQVEDNTNPYLTRFK